MILTALLLGTLLQSSLQQNRTAHDSGSQATAEGIEILRRIVVDQVDETFAPQEEKARGVDRQHRFRMLGTGQNGFVTELWAGGQTVTHSRGFHLPGHGALIVMDLSLPTVEREEQAEEPEDPRAPTDDEWEAMRRRVRGGPEEDHVVLRGDLFEHGKPVEIDEAAIERVRETVIKTVARHASRIDGLQRDETITVALHLSGNGGNWLSNFSTLPFTTTEDGDDDESSENGLGLAQTYTFAARAEAPEQHLVLEIPLADLDEFAQGGYSRLAPRVRVTRY